MLKKSSINILVACEESGTVRDHFRKLGYNAWSCDLVPDRKGSQYHFQGDVRTLLGKVHPSGRRPLRISTGLFSVPESKRKDWLENSLNKIQCSHPGPFPLMWHLVIAHPPCTDLSVSGARHFARKRADGSQDRAIEFFLYFTMLSDYSNRVSNWVIENPIGIMSTEYRKPDQIIHPWQFGHKERKPTCLWYSSRALHLSPENIVGPPPRIADMTSEERRQWCRIHFMSPGKKRGTERSVTYPGIASAMARQWGSYLCSLHSKD